MLIAAMAFFTVAALLGVYLLSLVLTNKETPKGVVFTHGPMAATGLIILIIYAIFNHPAPIVSIIIFLLAALGGIIMIARDITGKPVPKWLALGHGIAAVIGFVFLIIFTFF